MNKSVFILNDEYLDIETIVYNNRELSIKTTNNYTLNIDLNLQTLKMNQK